MPEQEILMISKSQSTDKLEKIPHEEDVLKGFSSLRLFDVTVLRHAACYSQMKLLSSSLETQIIERKYGNVVGTVR